jgi:hypothetical protein
MLLDKLIESVFLVLSVGLMCCLFFFCCDFLVLIDFFALLVQTDWREALPVAVAKPSAASRRVVESKLLYGSATVHPFALQALQCCEGDELPPIGVSQCAMTLLETLRRFETNETSGMFGQTKSFAGELRESSLLTEALCRRLGVLQNGGQLRWFHQLPDPANGRIDIALYVSEKQEQVWLPVGIIEVGYKDGSSKRWQAASYGINVAPQLLSEQQGLLVVELLLDRYHLERPSTKLRALAPALSWEEKGKIWCAPIWEGDADEEALARVLWALVSAAEMSLQPPTTHTRIGPNTCRDGDFMLKCFDYRYREEPVPQEQRRSPSLSQVYLNSENVVTKNHLSLIRYPCVKGCHAASCVAQFIEVIEQLRQIHKSDMFHGDVRGFNIVFGMKSTLIDFDFGGQGKRYPDGFNINIPDAARHPNARGGQRLCGEHDWFAMAAVMKLHEPEMVEHSDGWESAILNIHNTKVPEALQILGQVPKAVLKPTEKYQSLFTSKKTATGSPTRGE